MNTLSFSSIHIGKVVILGLILGLGVGYASAFVNAPGTPPTCPTTVDACNAPIHKGAADQTKTGGLTVGGFAVVNTASVGGRLGIGTATPGRPLEVNDTTGNGEPAYFRANGASNRVYIDHISSGGSNANSGFGLKANNSLKWSVATYNSSTNNYDFTIWNDQGGVNASALFIDGNSNQVQVSDLQTSAFQMPTGAAANRVLTSDAQGRATWQASNGGGLDRIIATRTFDMATTCEWNSTCAKSNCQETGALGNPNCTCPTTTANGAVTAQKIFGYTINSRNYYIVGCYGK